jgi:hypothetical protein
MAHPSTLEGVDAVQSLRLELVIVGGMEGILNPIFENVGGDVVEGGLDCRDSERFFPTGGTCLVLVNPSTERVLNRNPLDITIRELELRVLSERRR